ncbi:hypothetical protein AUJ17_01875 [Candidatus Micrarchaeota archaeon CG1_02_47_40]|nr:MAG: hypothetical protein AUJ17_01875 [Candidatus Micrarchaeota archaeon CG1_02_47_40]
MDANLLAAREIAKNLIRGKANLDGQKKDASRKYCIAGVVRNSLILNAIPQKKRSKRLLSLLRLRKTRTLSGVTPVAIMSLSDCPHGRCIYCPRGENAAQSYTGEEPASLRAKQNKFDSFSQVNARLRQYKELGHPTDKCELIIMGGTFLSQSREYKENFMKGAFEALNGKRSRSLEDVLKQNEKTAHRAIGVTFETRPDWAKEKHVDEMLSFGGTRVELGVQTLSDEVYKKVKRGHTIKDVIEATQICRDAGLKICYHMMPGLFCNEKEDIAAFRRLFSDPSFRPDMLKIYPCLVLKGTELYEMWKRGEYTPYDSQTAAKVIVKCAKFIPPYVRIMRMQRDIPAQLIIAGVKKSNLRQLVEEEMKKRGLILNDIRAREIGLAGKKIGAERIILHTLEYAASGGKEFFLSFEDKKRSLLVGFLRLRFPFAPHRKEITRKTAIVRELHIYGQEVGIGKEGKGNVQHMGYGKKLLQKAEEIARKNGMDKLAVISGIGAREYYRKLGYSLEGAYMVKRFHSDGRSL